MSDTGSGTGGADDFNNVWIHIQDRLKGEMGEQSFQSWIAELQAIEVDERSVLIEAPNKFCRDYVEQNFGFKIRKYWVELDARRNVLRFGAAQRAENGFGGSAANAAKAAERTKGNVKSAPRRPISSFTSPGSMDRSFDNFVVGPANEVAAAVARQIAGDETARFNPVFLYGPYGVGKTHLLRAIQAEANSRNPDRRVVYLTGEKFVAEFCSAVKTRDTSGFKNEVRNTDLLLLDDLHIMAGKAFTQEEFYHTLSDLIQGGHQVVVTGDRPPGQLEGLDERLRSLLSGGLRADIAEADLDLRRRILDQGITDLQNTYPDFEIGAQARDFIAARVTASPRELIGALNTVLSRTLMVGREATTEAVMAALADYAVAAERRITVDTIQKQVASYYNLKVPEMLSQRRARAVARPRQIAMYLAKTMTQRSLPDIGRRFGGRDHTTVLHAVRRIGDLMKNDAAIHDDVEALIRILER